MVDQNSVMKGIEFYSSDFGFYFGESGKLCEFPKQQRVMIKTLGQIGKSDNNGKRQELSMAKIGDDESLPQGSSNRNKKLKTQSLKI